MAFCRWSCDDGMCDLYIYSDVHGGYTCHVAGRRRDWQPTHKLEDLYKIYGDETLRPEERDQKFKKFFKGYKREKQGTEYKTLPKPSTGESFNVETVEEMIEKVKQLGKEGFRYPDDLISKLQQKG